MVRKAHNRLDIVGEKFHKLTVLKFHGNHTYPCGDKKSNWLCVCDCGSEVVVNGSSLTAGNTKSCGCDARTKLVDRNKKHGLARTRTYRIWQAMLNRCRNKNVPNYKDYGGRGISVFKEWENFDCFFSDMGEAPHECSIERIDNDGNYEPENCVWASRHEQARNRRNNRMISFDGKKQCLTDWAKDLNIDQASLRERLDKWPLERALTQPKRELGHG